MDVGFKSPLLDLFRRGEVEREVRMLAARGAVAPRAGEQLALLVLLMDDQDPEIRATADETLDRIPREPLRAFLARSDVSRALRSFFAGRGVDPAAVAAETADEPLIERDEAPGPAAVVQASAAHRLAHMTIGERIKAAMKGSREERAILIRDSSKAVAAAVLSSPKLSESEIEVFARLTSVSDEVLRAIGSSQAWLKNYNVLAGLARNPKTPLALSLGLVPRLIERDLRMLVADRNVPDALRRVAKKALMTGEARRH